MDPLRSAAILLLLAMAGLTAFSQVVPNRGLTPADLELARSLANESGGATAELVYAHRFDPITRGKFDSILVLYSRRSDSGPAEYFAFIHLDGQRLVLALDPSGRVLPHGDLFLRIGLRRLPDQSPILRIVGSFNDPVLGSSLRNVDFQFNRTGFLLIGQSVNRSSSPPRD